MTTVSRERMVLNAMVMTIVNSNGVKPELLHFFMSPLPDFLNFNGLPSRYFL
ncbi:hypothetical protein Metal_1364 [Methylomicrobium album BG8]|uniref:Uncharacterized protein n=1 Tax=Methylomicrobium album BG8 TaxID=686340 RepID=H8GK27_METAL|nr:hypothetical protein Metal_1364 [Methylomicrobium album BG8]